MRYGERTFSLAGTRNYGEPVVPTRLDLSTQRPLELLPEQCPELPELALCPQLLLQLLLLLVPVLMRDA